MAEQELREMVIRGAHEYPGAVAVEDELGCVILLHKLPREVGAPSSPSIFNTSIPADRRPFSQNVSAVDDQVGLASTERWV